jgi:DNA-binding NtrC family response regulator
LREPQPVPLILKRVLFVDDEAGIRNTLPAILRRYGFTVTVASTVQEALDYIQAHEFDLLLCDLNIERKGDGFTVITALRKVNPRSVAIVLTGYPDIESAVEGIHTGIDDYITKPANADALVAVLANKLAEKFAKKAALRSGVTGLVTTNRVN